MPLVVDCCSLVHAKAMAGLTYPPLELLSQLAEGGARFVCTRPVLGELEESSLRDTLRAWELEEWLTSEAATSNERKRALNSLRRRDPIPGRNDVGLVTVAWRLDAPLLTHDEAASGFALRLGVTVIDLVDVAAWAARAGLATVQEISAAWGDLASFPWPGASDPWSGSVTTTLEQRPKLEEVVDVLVTRAS